MIFQTRPDSTQEQVVQVVESKLSMTELDMPCLQSVGYSAFLLFADHSQPIAGSFGRWITNESQVAARQDFYGAANQFSTSSWIEPLNDKLAGCLTEIHLVGSAV